MPPRMPSQSASSDATCSVGRSSVTDPPISSASASASAKRCSSGPGGAVEAKPSAARVGSPKIATSSCGPHIASATRRATRASSAAARSGLREVVDDERAERDVEGAVVERQLLGVGVQELDVRVGAARVLEHALGEVDAGHVRAPRRGRRGQRTRPAADVEHTHARPDLRRVQQRLDRERRRARHQRAVGPRAGAPAVGLEGLEGV